MKTILFNNAICAYDVCLSGSATTILYLHGWACDHKIFNPYISLLNYNYIVVDFPPFGESDEPKDVWDVSIYAKLVEQILAIEKVDKVNIICHSFGGRVALELATKTNLVNSLVLIDVAGIRHFSLTRNLKVIEYKVEKWLARIGMLDDYFIGSSGSEDYKTLSPLLKTTFSRVVNYNQKRLVKKITQPALIIWGKSDLATPIRDAYYLHKNIKKSTILFLDGDHFAFIMPQNIGKVSSAIYKFLKQTTN